MARKEDAKRKTRRKLTLSKETIRDLTPTKDKDAAVRGGRADGNTLPPTFCLYCK